MPINNDYVCSAPEIPQYAPDVQAENPDCGCGGGSVPFYTPPNSGGKPVEVIAGVGISVEDLSDVNAYRFRVNAVSYTALTTNLVVPAPFIGGVSALLNNLVLFGRIVDRVDLSWSYNKTVASQNLASNIPGFVQPTLTLEQRDISLTGLTVDQDRSFTITGDDGSGQPGGITADTEFVRYGNLVRWGKGAEKLGGLASSLQALFNALAGSVNTNTRARSFFATGGVNEYEYYFLPARFGEVIFQKDMFVGGFIRLKNVDGTLYQTVPDGETEDPILISNGYASENYYVYQSLYDGQNDPVTPINAS
jgi:hypothetical protein